MMGLKKEVYPRRFKEILAEFEEVHPDKHLETKIYQNSFQRLYLSQDIKITELRQIFPTTPQSIYFYIHRKNYGSKRIPFNPIINLNSYLLIELGNRRPMYILGTVTILDFLEYSKYNGKMSSLKHLQFYEYFRSNTSALVCGLGINLK
jgi:hypothetical protein